MIIHIYPRSNHEVQLQQLEQKEEVINKQKIQLFSQAKDEGAIVYFSQLGNATTLNYISLEM